MIICFLIILSFTCVSSAGIIDEIKSGQEKIKSVESQFVQEQNTKLLSLLIDDILVVDAGGLTSSLSFPEQRKLKAALLTHQHYDHIRDIPTVAMNSG